MRGSGPPLVVKPGQYRALIKADSCDERYAAWLVEYLANHDVRCRVAPNGAPTLDRHREQPFDAVMMVYGECPQRWIDERSNELEAVLLDQKDQAPVCGFYLDRPRVPPLWVKGLQKVVHQDEAGPHATETTTVDPGGTSASPVRITWDEHYVETTGLSKSLDLHANDLFARLTEPQQRIAEQLFRCLGERGPHGQLVRRVSSVREVCGVVRAGFDALDERERRRQVDAVIEVVDAFRQPGVHFLVTTPPGMLTIDSQIDISHESLLRQWEKSQRWLADEQNNVDAFLQLVRAAEQKEKNERALLDEIELREKLRWREKYQPTATWADRYARGRFAAAMTYLEDSRAAAGRREADKQRALREEAERTERELKRSQRLNFAAVAIVVVLGGLLFWAYRAQGQANRTFEQLQRKSTEATAVALMAGLNGESRSPTVGEYKTVELLADSNSKVRVAFLKHLLTSPNKAERLRQRFPHILHALVGLNVQERDRFARLLLEYGKTPETSHLSVNITCAELGRLLDVDTPEFRVMIARNYFAAMEKTTGNHGEFVKLSQTLGPFGAWLPPEQAAAGATAILRLLAFDFKDGVPRRVAQSLSNLVGAMAPDDTLSILKSPVCVRGVRQAVLSGLEKKTGQTFDGNIWKAVRWAESQRIDVAAVPQCPLRTDVGQ